MNLPSPPMLQFEDNITSQCGEDGVIRRALEVVGCRDRWCVEFGAFDGKYASNTYSLIERGNYSAVLIESDPTRFAALRRTYADRPGIIALNRAVSFEGSDCLDRILAETPIPRTFDLLSVDIDGNDYHVWDACKQYKPKLVVIEYNPTLPNEVDFVQPRDLRVRQGSSLTAMARLGRSKGYRLVHATVVNGIFVDEKYFPRFGIPDDSPSALRADLSQITWLFQTYDGCIHLAGNQRARWHDVPLPLWRFQAVPRPLRAWPEDFSRRQHIAWRVWRALHEPRAALRRLRLARSAPHV